jgi:hypothetical protein
MRYRPFILLCLLAFPAAISASAAPTLAFENRTVEVTLEPGSETTEISFPFRNNTSEPIEIARHASPCGCISASFKDGKKTYLPGEKGNLEAVFKVGSFSGTLSKQVIVWQKGDSETAPSIVLTAKITIPELLPITPRTLNWATDGAPTPASYRITVNHKEPIRVTGVVVTNSNFRTELKTVTDGREYELVVTPLDTSETSFGIVKITSDSDISRYRLTQAFAYVRPMASGE